MHFIFHLACQANITNPLLQGSFFQRPVSTIKLFAPHQTEVRDLSWPVPTSEERMYRVRKAADQGVTRRIGGYRTKVLLEQLGLGQMWQVSRLEPAKQEISQVKALKDREQTVESRGGVAPLLVAPFLLLPPSCCSPSC